MQAQTCTLSSPWVSNMRFPWCTRCGGSYFDNENGMDILSSFHQYSHLMVRPSVSISRLVYSSWLQAQTCTLSSLWSSNTRFVWCTRCCSYFDDENGVEEWSSFHQYLHLMVRLCTLISRVVFPSWLPGQTRTLSSPGSSNTRFPWFYQEIRFCFS